MAPTAETSPKARLAWTDKVALVVGLALLALIGFLWLFAIATIGSAGAQHLFRKSGESGLALDVLVTGSLWVFLQGVDFAGRGIYRLFTRHHGRARLAQGSLIDGRPFHGTVSALPFETTQALAPLVARPVFLEQDNNPALRTRPAKALGAL